MENKPSYVLAMYDVRAKQNYIYRSKKLKEIQGASDIIVDCFKDHLFPEAVNYRNSLGKYTGKKEDAAIYNYKDNTGEKVFSYESFEKRMADDQYLGEVVYDGGGNFIILFKDAEVCKEITYLFGRRLLTKAPGLNVLCTFVEDVQKGNYYDKNHTGDYQKLYQAHRKNENQESTVVAYGTLPITQADYLSSMPLTKVIYVPEDKSKKSKSEDDKSKKSKPEKVTAESYAKYKKFKTLHGKAEENKSDDDTSLTIDEKILDNLVTEKGRESLLAIIYIDGNNMGAKVQRLLNDKNRLKDKADYDTCVNKLRKFSDFIQKQCVDDRVKEIDGTLKARLLDKLIEERKRSGEASLTSEDEINEAVKTRRLVVNAGDEITVICNARFAFDIATEYLKNIYESTKDIKDDEGVEQLITSCAGISIFHSHTPFSDAYRIAEECCENGKKKMKALGIQEGCFLDYHYCQGAIGISLEDMRKIDETTDYSLPWLIVKPDKDCDKSEEENKKFTNVADIEAVREDLNNIGRSNVKGLAEKAKEGLAALEMEIKRIMAHRGGSAEPLKVLSKIIDDNTTIADKEKDRKLIYDMVNVCDLWFLDEKSGVSEDE